MNDGGLVLVLLLIVERNSGIAVNGRGLLLVRVGSNDVGLNGGGGGGFLLLVVVIVMRNNRLGVAVGGGLGRSVGGGGVRNGSGHFFL